MMWESVDFFVKFLAIFWSLFCPNFRIFCPKFSQFFRKKRPEHRDFRTTQKYFYYKKVIFRWSLNSLVFILNLGKILTFFVKFPLFFCTFFDFPLHNSVISWNFKKLTFFLRNYFFIFFAIFSKILLFFLTIGKLIFIFLKFSFLKKQWFFLTHFLIFFDKIFRFFTRILNNHTYS